MKKKLFVLLLIMSMLGLCACSKSAEKTIAEETTAATAQEVQTEPAVKETAAKVAKEAAPETEPEPVANEAPPVSLLHLIVTETNRGMNVGSNYEGYAYVNYPAFSLTPEDAIRYPKLEAALDTLGSHYETEYLDHLTYSHELGEEALADGTDMSINFYDNLTPEIRRADSHIVSILENYDMYAGGPHGYNAFYGDNFDPATGKALSLYDVVTNMDIFRDTVKEKLYSQYPNVEFDDLDEALSNLETDNGSVMPWTMDYAGVTLYFNPYHLSSYAAGMQVITVPFNENPDIFVQDYLDVPDVYVQQLNSLTPAILDVNDDGMNETVFVTEEDEYYEEGYSSGYKNWIVICGGDEVTIADGCYYSTPYLVRANGQYYVYIFEVSDNDYSLCTVVDLKTMKNDSGKKFNASLAMLESDYEYNDGGYTSAYSKFMFTDPDSIPLSSRIEVLGSNSGTKLYRVGKDGWPKSDDPDFELTVSTVLKAKQDTACKEVDENGTEISDTTIKAGKHYVLVRTNNKDWADVQELKSGEFTESDEYPYSQVNNPDGIRTDRPIYRLPYQGELWPKTINGIEEEELFDGILYAG